MVVKSRQYLVKVTSSCDIASRRIQGLLEAYFHFKRKSQWPARKRIHYLCDGGIEKSIPPDHYLSSLGKLRDAKQWSSEQIFLSHPHTHGRYLYSNHIMDIIKWNKNRQKTGFHENFIYDRFALSPHYGLLIFLYYRV